jgi:hypothetical protein
MGEKKKRNNVRKERKRKDTLFYFFFMMKGTRTSLFVWPCDGTPTAMCARAPMDRAHAVRRRVAGGALPLAASQSDKGMPELRLLLARVDSGGGPNLPAVQRRAATSALLGALPALVGFGRWPRDPLAGGVTSAHRHHRNRVAVVSGRQPWLAFACSVGLQLQLAVVVLVFSKPPLQCYYYYFSQVLFSS